MRRVALCGMLAARVSCAAQSARAVTLPSPVLSCRVSYSTTPPRLLPGVCRTRALLSQPTPTSNAVSGLPAELYSTTLLRFRADDTYPTLTQNLREYLQAQKKTSLAAAVSDECSVEEYLRQPATYCANEQVRRRIDDMPGMRVARGLQLLWQAHFATVGEWAGAERPMRVSGMSDEIYETVKQAVRAAAARAAQRSLGKPAGAKDEYGQTCEQLLPAGVGKALYASVYDATWGALCYTTTDDDANGVCTVRDGVGVLAQPLDDYGMELPQGDDDYAAQHRTKGDVLYTLHSRHGWPTQWSEVAEAVSGQLPATAPLAPKSSSAISTDSDEYNSTLFVRYEVQRAWRNIAALYNKRNPSAMLDTLPFVVQPPHVQKTQTSNVPRPVAVLVYGAPGIGKTVSGNYMVYRLLRDDNAPLRIAFAVDECVYIFDKQHKCVSCYKRATFDRRDFATACSRRCVYIHDCDKGKHKLGQSSHCYEALTVALSSPNSENYKDYIGKAPPTVTTTYVVTHTWSYRELYCVARLVGLDHDVMQDRVFTVGPLPRYVFDKTKFNERARKVRVACAEVATAADSSQPRLSLTMMTSADDKKDPTNVLYDLRRNDRSALYSGLATTGDASDDTIVVQRGDGYVVESLNDLPGMIIKLMAKGMLQKMYDILQQKCNNMLDTFYRLTAEVLSHGQSYELLVKMAIVVPRFWQQLHDSTDKDGKPRFHFCVVNEKTVATTTPLTLADIQQWTSDYEGQSIRVVEVDSSKLVKLGAKEKVCVYVPLKRNFTLVDFFLLIRLNGRVHFVGVQATIGNKHPVKFSNVPKFVNDMPEIEIEPAAVTAATHNAGRGSEHKQRDNSTADDATARDGGGATTATSQQSSSAAAQAHQGGEHDNEDAEQKALQEKLARLTSRIASWSVLYIGENLSFREKFNLVDIVKQVGKQSAGTATAAADSAAAPAKTTRLRSDKAAVTSGMRAADAVQRQEGQARRDVDSSATTTTTMTDEAHQATQKVYIDFWSKTHRYVYKAPPTLLQSLTKKPDMPQQR